MDYKNVFSMSFHATGKCVLMENLENRYPAMSFVEQ